MLKDKKLDAKEARRLAELNKIDEDVLTEMLIRDLIKEAVDKGRFSIELGYQLSDGVVSNLASDGYKVRYSPFDNCIPPRYRTLISW